MRNTEWHNAAKKLFKEGKTVTQIAEQLGKSKSAVSRVLNPKTPPPSQIPLPVPSERLTQIRNQNNNSFLIFIAVLAMIAVSVVVTGPILIHAIKEKGIHIVVGCYLIALFVDIAPILFVMYGQEKLGGIFSLATGLQVAIACNVFSPENYTECVKGIIISSTVALAVYGMAAMAKSKQ